MLKIDEERLFNELQYMGGELISKRHRGIIVRDIDGFEALNEVMKNNFGKTVSIEDKIEDEQDFDHYLSRAAEKADTDYFMFFARNELLLKRMATQYLNCLRKMRYPHIKETQIVLGFNKKDYIDIILSYYAQFGDKYYRIAKKYFDEKRIHMDTIMEEKTCPAFFSGFQKIGSGYIFLRNGAISDYTSYGASYLVHELGHAIDSETFLFKQQKDLSIDADILGEIPSTAFEVGFNDYLRDNCIDSEGADALSYYNIDGERHYLRDLKNALNSPDPFEYTIPGYNDDTSVLDKSTVYGVAYLFALNLNAIRRDSIKEFLKVFNNIITSRKEASLEQLIEMTGMSLEDFVTLKYAKPQIEENSMRLKKKYNR